MSSREQRLKRTAEELQDPNTRWKGVCGVLLGWGTVTFCKVLWNHVVRTLDLSLDEVEGHEGALLLPCWAMSAIGPFTKWRPSASHQGGNTQQGHRRAQRLRRAHLLREVALTFLQLRCAHGRRRGYDPYAYPPLALIAASVTSGVKKQKGHQKQVSMASQ